MLTHIALLALTLSVTDGDTFVAGGKRVRIANIDAPELKTAKCDAEARLGLISKRRLEEILASGQVSIMVGDPATGRKIDRHGRVLATVEVKGRDVGEMLIAEGLVRPWEGKRRSWCAPR